MSSPASGAHPSPPKGPFPKSKTLPIFASLAPERPAARAFGSSPRHHARRKIAAARRVDSLLTRSQAARRKMHGAEVQRLASPGRQRGLPERPARVPARTAPSGRRSAVAQDPAPFRRRKVAHEAGDQQSQHRPRRTLFSQAHGVKQSPGSGRQSHGNSRVIAQTFPAPNSSARTSAPPRSFRIAGLHASTDSKKTADLIASSQIKERLSLCYIRRSLAGRSRRAGI